MENSIERIGMAQWFVGKAPGIITTIGLGSCVGVALYDPITKIGGMLHLMLSDSTRFAYNENINRAKFADTGIRDMLDNNPLSYGMDDEAFDKLVEDYIETEVESHKAIVVNIY